MKYNIKPSSKFKKDLKLAKKRGLNISLLQQILTMLADGRTLPPQYKNHELKGEYIGCMECHIQPDWLLVYKINGDELLITLVRTGSHSDLFAE